MDVEWIDEHLKTLAERFNVGFIMVLDENFSSDRKSAYELARAFKKHDMLWMAGGIRVSSLDGDDIRFYKEHNCTGLKFGVESGSQTIMDIMEKKFTVERVFQTLKHCADVEMFSPIALMVGMPGETCETAAETGRFLGRLCHMQGVDPVRNNVSVFYALPLPGTPLYRYGQQAGVIGKSPDEEEEFLFAVSGAAATKRDYINLNGSKIRDILWWDYLVLLEAEHTFRELERKEPVREGYLQRMIISEYEENARQPGPGRRTILRAVKGFVRQAIMSLPRWIKYPILQNMHYARYLRQKLVYTVTGERVPNLYKKWAPVKPLTEVPKVMRDINVARSLRRTVRITAKEHPAASKTEAIQDVLSVGL